MDRSVELALVHTQTFLFAIYLVAEGGVTVAGQTIGVGGLFLGPDSST